MDLIAAIRSINENANVFVCSEYLSENHWDYEKTREYLLDSRLGLNLSEDHLVAKNKFADGTLDIEGNKILLIQHIFSSLQQPASLPKPE